MESASIFLIVAALVIGIVSTDDELRDKRRPGWGKRSDNDLETDYSDSIMEKRKPGWGKRDMNELEMNKRKPGWGKRAGLNSDYFDKRSPGWGKRSFNEDIKSFVDKRRPGWGKRTADLLDSLNNEISKRAPGWGKRSEMEKRKPGWGKRTFPEPSDKDSTYSNLPYDISDIFNKRAPGWGKRSSDIFVERRRPGWGKRAPGWGKRSNEPTCQDIDLEIQRLLNTILKLEEERRSLCGKQSMTSGEFESLE